MNILLSNDDGVYAPGLKSLYDTLKDIATVKVFAPDRDRSCISSALTISEPLRMRQLDEDFFIIEGTPADCVHFALTTDVINKPDLVVSGINAGANLGNDVIYSGTVAAATEAHILGYPAIAVSLTGSNFNNYDSAATIIKNLIISKENFIREQKSKLFLNINVPDKPITSIKGLRTCSLGKSYSSRKIVQDTDPRGKIIYWINDPDKTECNSKDTDFFNINEDFVSITPLQIDMTNYNNLTATELLLKDLKI